MKADCNDNKIKSYQVGTMNILYMILPCYFVYVYVKK